VISVIVPTRDTRDLTLACLESVHAVEPAAEVILIDDGSRDRTADAVAERFPDSQVLRNAEPLGFTASANRGLGSATGQVLLLLNSDTELLPGSTEALRRAFAEDDRLGIAGAALRYPGGEPQWSGGRAPGLGWLFALASGVPRALERLPGYRRGRPVSGTGAGDIVDWVTGAALTMRREVWERVGPLDESFRFYAQDLDLCLRAREAGWRTRIVPGFRVVHHHGATIGRARESVRRQHPELLWSDLLRWARKHRGPVWARRAALALLWGGRLRVTLRWMGRPFLPRSEHEAWQRDTLTYERALAAITQQLSDF
jgi:GT2 family glycosyltransferase